MCGFYRKMCGKQEKEQDREHWTSKSEDTKTDLGIVCCKVRFSEQLCAGNLSPAMGARNQVGIGLSYRPASLCSMASQFQTRFLESIPRPIAGLKIPTLIVMPT
jgi:hypothetical protein